MPLFEIIREDGVVVYQLAPTIVILEENFLFVCRYENNTQSFIVYYLNENLERTGRKKKYLPYKDDAVLRKEMKTRSDKLLGKIIEQNFKDYIKIIPENS